MKTAVLYNSRKGYVAEVAGKIGESLKDKAEVCDIKISRKLNLADYDAIVLAGSVIAGRFNPKIKKYIQNNKANFSGKKIYLVSAGLDDKEYMTTLERNFPDGELKLFTEIVYAGGRYLPEQHNALIRKLMAKINKAEGALIREKPENIEKLIKNLS